MSVILVLVAFSVLLAGGFLVAFFWSVRSGQYDDAYGSSVRMLFEDEVRPGTGSENQPKVEPSFDDNSPK